MTRFEYFEQYLAGELTTAEKTSFEQQLKDDPGFAIEFEQYQTLQSDGQQWQQSQEDREKLKQTLGRITGKNNKKAVVRSMGWYLQRVAAVLVITALAWWLFTPPASKSKALYSQYASGETISSTRGNDADSLWAVASGLFYDKKYAAAPAVLQQIIDSGKDSTKAAAVFIGYCFMQTNNDTAAENILSRTNISNAEVAERSRWYLALLYLKTGREQLCRKILGELVSAGAAYAGKAAQLLKEMR